MRWMILVPLAALAMDLSAQNDTIFPNVHGDWTVEEIYVDGMGGWWVVDGNEYNLICDMVVQIDGQQWMYIFGAGPPFEGRMMVDSGRVYFKDLSTGADTSLVRLLYDFNLQLGDTAYFDCHDSALARIVTSIDTVHISGRPRKRLILDNDEEWIAGMGSTEGLFRPFDCQPLEGYFEAGFCGDYIDIDSVAYHSCWPFDLGVQELTPRSLSIAPNPSDGDFVVRWSGRNAEYRLFDAHGALLGSGTLQAPATIVSIAQPGLYVLRVNGISSRLVVE